MFFKLTLRQKLTYCAHLFKAISKQHHKNLIPLLQPSITPDSIVLDVGGHAGQITKLFSKLTPNGTVYAFEPGSYAFSILRKTKAFKRLSNVTLINQGLSNAEGEVILEVPLKHSGSMGFGISHIVETTDKAAALSFRESISVTTLDSFVEKEGLKRIDFIKIDVEGHELKVLEGGLDVLQRFKPVLMVEVNEGNFERAGYSPSDFFAFMEAAGYSACYIDEEFCRISPTHYSQNGDYLFSFEQ